MNGGMWMGRSSKVIAGATLSAAVLYATYFFVSSNAQEDGQPAAEATPSSPVTPSPQSTTSRKPFTRSESGYRWDASKPGIATSEADAAWLESKGFPGPDVEDHLRRLSLQELESLAARGNQPAAAIYAYKLATSGRPPAEVLTALSKSANEGSVYALKTAGDIYMTVDGYRDPAIASAYYGLQARAGDQAGFEQRYLLSPQLNNTQRLRSDLMQEMLLRSMGSTLQSPAGLDPRPGFNEFVKQGITSISTQEE
ncbi:hypothetical protein [Stenotrophomonas oahuensis]|uniref:Uncharacterized protein n=1 Tax=Stenotrophomonas oahuensis TaxID=3003271 RepID=A0ABY9YUJ7_9GAMM|nr:hypothetical protein [Stenotrophomonas sp. A5586]WNH54516.1 hypothetical protein PDM29_09645 [Stenotrophomonas sp. A5586]